MRLLTTLLLTAACAVAADAQTAVVQVTGDTTALVNEPINAAVALSGSPTPAVQFETPLSATVTLGSAAVSANKTLQCLDQPVEAPTSKRCMIYAPDNVNTIVGEAAKITFAPEASLGPVLLNISAIMATDTSPQATPLILDYTGLTLNVVTSPCDLDGDLTTDVGDLLLSVGQALGANPCTNADLNQDGACNVSDVQILTQVILDQIACPL